MPEAWCGQEDKYSKLLLGFYFTCHLSLCHFFECKTCRPPTSAVVHLQSALFGQALLWHRCGKKEIKPEEQSYRTPSLSLSFVLVSRESFLWRKPWQDSQKPPINILVRKAFSSHKSDLCVWKSISVDKTNLWFDWTGIRSSRMSVTLTVCPHSRRVHIKPAKSEEDNLKNIFFLPQDLHPHQGQMKNVCFMVKATKTASVSLLGCQRWEM